MNGDSIAGCQWATQSFPPGALVAQSRIVYQNAPLETEEIRPSTLLSLALVG